jgi:hypothetical protein
LNANELPPAADPKEFWTVKPFSWITIPSYPPDIPAASV